MHRLIPPADTALRAALLADRINQSKTLRVEQVYGDGVTITSVIAEPVGVYYDIAITDDSEDADAELSLLEDQLGISLGMLVVERETRTVERGALPDRPDATSITFIRLCPRMAV